MLNESKNFISEYKDFFVVLLSLCTLLFSIFSYFKTKKEHRYKSNLDNLEILLKNFYSPILINHTTNSPIIIDDKSKSFFFRNSFLFDDHLRVLISELISLEANGSISNKKLSKKYMKTRKYFISLCNLIYKDYSKLYRIEFLSLKNKYFTNHTFRFIASFLDLSCIFFIIIGILSLFIKLKTFIISFLASISFVWFLYRYSLLSSNKNYSPKKHFFYYFPNRKIYFFNEFSTSDAIYKNLFTQKTFLIYKGLPIVHPTKKGTSCNFLSIYILYKELNLNNAYI